MERPRGFFTKRSEHYNNIQKEENNKKKSLEQNVSLKEPEKIQQEQLQSPKFENLDPNKAPPSKQHKQNERPLKCLETLAQKAGITFDEKYEMEKSQSPAQQVQQQAQQQSQQQQQQQQIQFTPEQYQQLQQYQQIQQAFANATPATIQVKQEYATQQQNHGISASDLKTLQDHQNQMQQIIVQESSPQSPHQHSLQQQVPAEWQHGRVQVLQQPLQNTQYIPQMYSPLVMSGNLLHSGLGQQQQIQVITAGKPFQNQLTPQMLSGGKPVITSGGQASFGAYTLPTIPSSQSQAVLFSPVNLNIQQQQNQQQQNMQNQSTPTKTDPQKQLGGQKILQKVSQGSNSQQQQTVTQSVASQGNQSNQQCVQVSQTMPTAQLLSGQTMQFAAPWQLQGMTPFWTNNIQPQTLLTTNPIFIRGTNPDGTPGMFIQQSPTQNTQQTVQSPHNQISLVSNITQTPTQKVRPASDNSLTPKTPQAQQRTAPILPHGAQIRPASSVSTQTAMNQNANLLAKAPKVRTKQTPVRPAANIKVQLNQQTGQPTMMQQVVQTQGGVNKMVVMSNINGQFTPVLQQNAAQQIMANNDKLKSQQQQQQIIQQAMANMQQNQFQQQIAAQFQLQQQQQQYIQQQSQNQLMAQSGNIQQVVLQHQQQLPTVTVTSGVSLQQAMPHVNQQSLMTTKAGQVIQLQPVSSQSASVPTSMANTQIVTSMAGSLSADTSNSILGPLTSPQTPLQPPQNPLIAMTTLSASPMSVVGVQKEKADAASGDSQKISMSVTMSPLKRQAEDSKQPEAKKQMTEDIKKSDESTNTTTSNTMLSPSINKTQSAPGTPTSSTKTSIVNSPLAAQNGDSDPKKSTSNASTNVPMLKNELPKAMVKPNVLTHVIEGYVIQESNEPFPVTRQRYSEKENDEPPKKKQAVEDTKPSDTSRTNGDSGATSNISPSSAPSLPTDMVPCDHCGKQEMRGKLKKKRFCSLTCAKATKSTTTDSPNVSLSNGDDKISTPNTPNDKSKLEVENCDLPAVEEHVMLKWSVAQVCDFIKNLPGCTDYAEDFKLQEIDGQALLLLKENHLVSAMGMKLGPALKIVNKIESMRVSKEGESTETPPDQQ